MVSVLPLVTCTNNECAETQVKEDPNPWGDRQGRRLRFANIAFLPQLLCGLNAIPAQFQVAFFVDTDKWVIKGIWKHTGPRLGPGTILTKRSRVEVWLPMGTLPQSAQSSEQKD